MNMMRLLRGYRPRWLTLPHNRWFKVMINADQSWKNFIGLISSASQLQLYCKLIRFESMTPGYRSKANLKIKYAPIKCNLSEENSTFEHASSDIVWPMPPKRMKFWGASRVSHSQLWSQGRVAIVYMYLWYRVHMSKGHSSVRRVSRWTSNPAEDKIR